MINVMKIENFHCTISIYPDLPWFHTWTSHTRPATFASITALLCNINISLLTSLYATTSTRFRAPASSDGCESEETPLRHSTTSHIFPKACETLDMSLEQGCWILPLAAHWRQNDCQFYLHLPKSIP